MTQPATLNGQVIGQAERATRAVLEVLLAETDTTSPTGSRPTSSPRTAP